MAKPHFDGSWFEPSGPAPEDAPQEPLWRRLAWFVGLAVAGLVVVATAAYAMRAMLFIG